MIVILFLLSFITAFAQIDDIDQRIKDIKKFGLTPEQVEVLCRYTTLQNDLAYVKNKRLLTYPKSMKSVASYNKQLKALAKDPIYISARAKVPNYVLNIDLPNISLTRFRLQINSLPETERKASWEYFNSLKEELMQELELLRIHGPKEPSLGYSVMWEGHAKKLPESGVQIFVRNRGVNLFGSTMLEVDVPVPLSVEKLSKSAPSLFTTEEEKLMLDKALKEAMERLAEDRAKRLKNKLEKQTERKEKLAKKRKAEKERQEALLEQRRVVEEWRRKADEEILRINSL